MYLFVYLAFKVGMATEGRANKLKPQEDWGRIYKF